MQQRILQVKLLTPTMRYKRETMTTKKPDLPNIPPMQTETITPTITTGTVTTTMVTMDKVEKKTPLWDRWNLP